MKTQRAQTSERITIRPTKEEYSQISDRAAGSSMSAYTRQCLFGAGAKRAKLRMPQINEVMLARVLAALGQSRLSSNLNQLAKAANIGALPVTEETETEIMKACAAVLAMRQDLIVALCLNAD